MQTRHIHEHCVPTGYTPVARLKRATMTSTGKLRAEQPKSLTGSGLSHMHPSTLLFSTGDLSNTLFESWGQDEKGSLLQASSMFTQAAGVQKAMLTTVLCMRYKHIFCTKHVTLSFIIKNVELVR